jgi:hypothetical protein
MKPIKLAVLTFIALAGIVVTTPAQVVVFNSFGPGNTYNSGIVWAISGASISGGYRGQAEFFTPGISGYLSSILLATYRESGGSGYSNFYIAQDNGSGIPGTILESFTNIQNANGLLTLNSTVQPLLQAGTEYWLCDEPTADNSYNGWYENNQGYANGFAFERSEWSWAAIPPPAPSSGVFRVSVTPVPEPSVTGLATLCVGCLLFLRLKKSVVVE